MDELNLKLSTKMMKGVIAKLLSKIISDKLGCKLNIRLEQVDVVMTDGKMNLHTELNADMATDEFVKLLKSVGAD